MKRYEKEAKIENWQNVLNWIWILKGRWFSITVICYFYFISWHILCHSIIRCSQARRGDPPSRALLVKLRYWVWWCWWLQVQRWQSILLERYKSAVPRNNHHCHLDLMKSFKVSAVSFVAKSFPSIKHFLERTWLPSITWRWFKLSLKKVTLL